MTLDLPPSANSVVPSAGFPGPGSLRRSWVCFTVPAGLTGRTGQDLGQQDRTYGRAQRNESQENGGRGSWDWSLRATWQGHPLSSPSKGRKKQKKVQAEGPRNIPDP